MDDRHLIRKGNNKIAEFMGYEMEYDPHYLDVYNNQVPTYLINGLWVRVDKMEYSRSWDALVPIFNMVFLRLMNLNSKFDSTTLSKQFRKDVRWHSEEYTKNVIHNKIENAFHLTVSAISFINDCIELKIVVDGPVQ